VTAATGQLASRVRELGKPGAQPTALALHQLRAQQRAVRLPTPAGSGAGPGAGQPAGPPDREADLTGLSGEAAGLFAATDSLVDAIDTAAEILGQPEQVR
jgi:hypothetical protein